MNHKWNIPVSVTENPIEYHRLLRIARHDINKEYESSIPRRRANVLRIRLKKWQLAQFINNNPKCSRCGLKATEQNMECFDFHHIKPKLFNLAPFTVSMKRLKEEAKKCILVCSNCHRIIHREIDDITLEI